MANFALIDVTVIKRKISDRKITRLIKKANKKAMLTGYKYIVLRIAGRVRLYKKSDLKYLLKTRYFKKGKSMRYFKKGVKIEDIEKNAIYITPQYPIYSKHELKQILRKKR